MIQFPKNFFWGAATSSYQVEGNNSNVDWWAWEKKTGHVNSGDACRHYELYEQDFDIAKSLNHNAHRLSIEWARIEPQEGQFSQKEMQHYIDVILALRKRGLEPMVTLHHFTNPIWLADKGGWENPKVAELFERYCNYVVQALAKHVDYWMTINEPTIVSSHSYIFGWWPPQVKSVVRCLKVQEHQIKAHVKAYELIHKIYRQQSLSTPRVGLAHHMPALIACTNTFRNRLAVRLRNWVFNFWFLDAVMRYNALDFIGLNYYSRQLVHTKGWLPHNLLGDVCQDNHFPLKKNFLGWAIYPQGLYDVLFMLKKYNLPVLITENGICAVDDQDRWEFIQEHLKSVHKALEAGVDIRGYLHWSLLDNFEWDKGFNPRFGLIEIDYKTQQRIVRPSAVKFSEICKSGQL